MTREQTVFLRILEDHLKGVPTGPIPGADWRAVVGFAQIHGLQGIVYHQCNAWLQGQRELENQYYSILQLGLQREKLLEEIKAAFSGAGIPMFIVKGPQAAGLYPVPFLRTMGDVDLVVKDKAGAEAVMSALGAVRHPDREDRDEKYTVKQFLFEVHPQLLYADVVNTPEEIAYFNDCWRHWADGTVDWDFQFMFLVVHLKKHLLLSGAGFRHFLDLAAAAARAPLDWKKIEPELKRLNLWQFTRTCFSLVERWFRIPSPVPRIPLEEGFFESVTQKIFSDGVFGFDNAENLNADAVNHAMRRSLPNGLANALRVLQEVFPPYRELQQWPGFGFLKGRPLLLPVGWAARIFRRLVRPRTKDALAYLKHAFPSAETVEKQKQAYRDWGL